MNISVRLILEFIAENDLEWLVFTVWISSGVVYVGREIIRHGGIVVKHVPFVVVLACLGPVAMFIGMFGSFRWSKFKYWLNRTLNKRIDL